MDEHTSSSVSPATEKTYQQIKAGRTTYEEKTETPATLPILAERIVSNIDHPVPPPSFDADAAFNPPDGGLRAWLQVLAALLINCMCWGYPASFGVFQLYYVETLGLPAAQVSWVGSTQVLLTMAICTVSGRLTDAGYTRHCVISGCLLAVTGTFMVSLAREYWQIFLAQGVCTGLGLGLTFMPSITTASSYFKKNRAFALAIAATGTSFGSLVFPSIVQYLIPQVGFPWAVRCAAFAAMVVCIVAILLQRPYLPPRKAGPIVEWGAFKELPYSLFALGAFLNHYVLYFGFFYVSGPFPPPTHNPHLAHIADHPLQINSFARERLGFTPVEAVSVLLISNAVGIPARALVGFVADRHLGPINAYAILLTFFAAALYGWTAVHSRTGMYVFSAFYGVVAGATQGVFVGALASLTSDPRKMGTRFGMVSTLLGFATLAGPPTAGAIIGQSGGRYTWAQVWGGSVLLLAAMAVVSARVALTGWKVKAKI